MTGRRAVVDEDKRFERLARSVQDQAIHVLDRHAGAKRFSGYDAGQIIGRHFSIFYPEDDRVAGAPAHALRTAEAEGRFDGGRLADAPRRQPLLVQRRHRSHSGRRRRAAGFAKLTRDLTERGIAAEALRKSEDLFRLLVESVTDDAIYLLDANGVISSWNAGAQRAKGHTADEIIGQHFMRFYGAEDRLARVPETALRTAREVGRFEAEGWRYRKDGTRFWASVVIDPVRDPAGVLLGYARVTRDLAERRAAQDALEASQKAFFQSQKLEAVGQLTGRPELKVLFITGYAEKTVIGDGDLEPGMQVLTRTFAIDTIARRIHSMIDGGRGH